MSLTEGVLGDLARGQEASHFIVQVLASKPVVIGQERFRLLISDGVYQNSFCLLDSQINHLIHEKKLEIFTIVKIKKYMYNKTRCGKKILNLMDLEVLKAGSDVGAKIGNPEDLASNGSVPPSRIGNQNLDLRPGAQKRPNHGFGGSASKIPATNRMSLTEGVLGDLARGQEASHFIVQVLASKPVVIGQERFRLLISDGVYQNSFCLLDSQLNHLIHEKKLEIYTIVKIKKYIYNKTRCGKKILNLMDLEVLKAGSDVGAKIGNPEDLASNGSVPPSRIGNQNLDPRPGAQKRPNHGFGGSASKIPATNRMSLTEGVLGDLARGQKASHFIVQVLASKPVGTGQMRFRLLISDGVYQNSFCLLDSQLNHVIHEKKLEIYTIVKIKKYIYNKTRCGKKILNLMDLEVLKAGSDVGAKIGNPENLAIDGSVRHRQELRTCRTLELSRLFTLKLEL